MPKHEYNAENDIHDVAEFNNPQKPVCHLPKQHVRTGQKHQHHKHQRNPCQHPKPHSPDTPVNLFVPVLPILRGIPERPCQFLEGSATKKGNVTPEPFRLNLHKSLRKGAKNYRVLNQAPVKNLYYLSLSPFSHITSLPYLQISFLSTSPNDKLYVFIIP